MAIDDSLERARLHPDVLKNLNKNKKLKTAEAYSEDNPPPYPVTSVNGQTGDVEVSGVDLPVSVQDGGTGATTAAQAAENLSVLPLGEVVTKIPENADLNDYTTPGVYAVRNNNVAATIANMPTSGLGAGTLRVFSSLGADITASSTYKYLVQEYSTYYGRTYRRCGDSGSGTTVTWYTWKTSCDSSDFPFSIAEGGTGATTAADARTNLAVLPLAGGTLTGQVKSTYANSDGFLIEHGAANKDACFRATRSDTGVSVEFGVGSGGVNHGIYSYKLGKWMIYGDGSNVYCNGTSTNVTGTVAVAHGGTGAGNAADARANLAVPNMQSDAYPTLLPPDGSNNWIKIGKANSSYGLLPSQTGGKGSGHNYIGTSYWYWSNAYVDNYYGSWKGDTIPVDKGGTGASSAAAARTNLGAIAMPTVIVKNTTTTSTVADATYTVSGSGVVIVFAGMLSDDTSDYGTFQSRIYYDGSVIMGEGTRWGSALNYMLGASTAVPIAVSNGKKIRIYLTNTKDGTKYVYRRFLCFGCTVS